MRHIFFFIFKPIFKGTSPTRVTALQANDGLDNQDSDGIVGIRERFEYSLNTFLLFYRKTHFKVTFFRGVTSLQADNNLIK